MLSFQWFKKHKLCLSRDIRPPHPQPKLTLNPGLTLSLPIYVKTNKWDDAHQGICYLVLGIAAHRCALWLFDYIFLIHLNSMRVIIKRDKSPRRPVNRKKKYRLTGVCKPRAFSSQPVLRPLSSILLHAVPVMSVSPAAAAFPTPSSLTVAWHNLKACVFPPHPRPIHVFLSCAPIFFSFPDP